jgi:hypothetical protein
MSLLDLPKKTSGRKITKNFLKKHHFYADRWGGPHDREKDTSVFYEAFYNMSIGIFLFPYSDYDHTITATIKYFPEEFDGYTTIGNNCNDWGRGNVAGKLVITYENRLAFEYNEKIGWTDTLVFDCKTHSDFNDAIDCFNLDLIKKGYEPIRY